MANRRSYWFFIRLLFFLTVGLLNTVFIKKEDVGSWQNYLGYILLLLAIIDIVILVRSRFSHNPNTSRDE